jgi:tRNA nucleotidyltransferase (CCA-adding enzyme)
MNTKYNRKIPQDARQIIQILEEAGHEAYIVGGCVRDLLMGREPNDWDITTSARPKEVKALFKRTYDTGIAHGTVTVILNKDHFEVTTYRIESGYEDFRRPDEVVFVDEITEDLSRRDFTMNAIAYHPIRGFIDPYLGQQDILKGCIRTVREAEERFTEDALRILRAVRFSAQLGFEIVPETLAGIQSCKELLIHISKERIRDEFLKILISQRPQTLENLYCLGLLPYILPQFEAAFTTPQQHPHHCYDVAHHTIEAIKHIEPTPVLCLAALLHDIGKPMTLTQDRDGTTHFYGHVEASVKIAKSVLKDLRLDNQTIKEVTTLIAYHDYHLSHEMDKITIKRLLSYMGEETFDKLLLLQLADAKAQHPDKLIAKITRINQTRARKREIIENNECYSLKQLAITGKDLIDRGVTPGKQVGEMLENTLTYVLENPHRNRKELLLERLFG